MHPKIPHPYPILGITPSQKVYDRETIHLDNAVLIQHYADIYSNDPFSSSS